MQKRGMTLIELIVAITLFVTVVSLATGGFIAVTRLKTLIIDMKNSQQKARLISETIYRVAKETSGATTGTDNIVFQYLPDASGDRDTQAFRWTMQGLEANSFKYYSCRDNKSLSFPEIDNGIGTISSKCKVEDLLSGTTFNNFVIKKEAAGDFFTLEKGIPLKLKIGFLLENKSNQLAPNINISNSVILENIQ